MTLIVWNLQKEEKNEVLCMLFQKSQMCFNESNYVTVHSGMNIMTANGSKMAQNMPGKCFWTIFICHLLEKVYYKHRITNVAVSFSCYVYIFAILSYSNMLNQCLTIFFSRNCVSLERYPLDEAKRSNKPLKK